MTFQRKRQRGQYLLERKAARVHQVARTLQKVCRNFSLLFSNVVKLIHYITVFSGKLKRNFEDEEDEEGFVSVKRSK